MKPNQIHVAIGVIINPAQHILVAERLPHASLAGHWEFPGGKVEVNEASYDALVRELKEEVGIDVIQAMPLTNIEHDYPEHSVILDVWKITEYQGEPHGREGQRIQWTSINTIDKINCLPPVLEIVKHIR